MLLLFLPSPLIKVVCAIVPCGAEGVDVLVAMLVEEF
jgi:hypothetical protein